MDKKLILLDLDDTLLTDAKTITPHTISVLKKCQQRSCILAINTVRGFTRSRDFAKQINADYINCSEGNFVLDSKNNIVHSRTISQKMVAKIIDISLSFNDITLLASETETHTFSTDEAYAKLHPTTNTHKEINDIAKHASHKLVFLSARENAYKKFKKQLKKLGYSCTIGYEVGMFRVQPSASNKWKGAKRIAKVEKIAQKNIIAFGDDVLDIKTLQKAGVGVKMKNSNHSLITNKKIAQITPDTNNHDGIAKFLEQFILNE